MSPRPLIALDADGVLLDYNLAYAKAWAKAMGTYPAERDPNAYWAVDRWDVERLEGERLEKFRSTFDVEFWSTIPPMESAVDACHRLHDHGYELVCVTALQDYLVDARLKNLRSHGFPIEKVFATSSVMVERSPKADILNQLRPAAFVDDYLPYMQGVDQSIHRALILREPNGSPNAGPDVGRVSSKHLNLTEFAGWWTATSPPLPNGARDGIG
ncbi:MAG: HAD family hydrolase [Pseudomonadota bacterium]